ncbi:hypothetical protein BC938DRAFT_480431 [Jimgerdemannia flammicorona]|uniref:Uncharacterized protein n=1 Tax=Jimgerdemannia flammicorona TaxID=994334 RepID=A0A433QIL0_9FUNG|nr:hypothetical protein BC938DRAFT_480431 [Jimgerdemannia flammicorona]
MQQKGSRMSVAWIIRVTCKHGELRTGAVQIGHPVACFHVNVAPSPFQAVPIRPDVRMGRAKPRRAWFVFVRRSVACGGSDG